MDDGLAIDVLTDPFCRPFDNTGNVTYSPKKGNVTYGQ